LVGEAAREYFEHKKRRSGHSYAAEDVLEIAQLQHRAEDLALRSGAPLVVADTDDQVLVLWWLERFADTEGPCPIAPPARQGVSTSYLFCYPDLRWQPDPLRENPLDRHRLFRRQMQMLDEADLRYRVIWGEGVHRLRLAQQYVAATLG